MINSYTLKLLVPLLICILLINCVGEKKVKAENEPRKVAVIISTLNNPWLVVLDETAANYTDKYFKGKRNLAQTVPVAAELVQQENLTEYTSYGSD